MAFAGRSLPLRTRWLDTHMAEAANPPEPSPPSPESRPLRRQRKLVYQAFRTLRAKYAFNGTWTPPEPIVFIDTDQETWDAELTRLRSALLPLLSQQLLLLAALLEPSALRADDGTRLRMIATLQLVLDQTLDQLTSLAAAIHPRPILAPAPTTDHHAKKLKGFLRQGVRSKITYLKRELCLLFDFGSSTIQKLRLAPEAYARQARKITYNTRRTCQLTTAATGSIARIFRWATGHEPTNIQEQWELELAGFDEDLGSVVELTGPTGHEEHCSESLSQDAIRLAHSLIPVIKLARLFFRKLARSGLNLIPPGSFTAMSSHQLHTLAESAGFVCCDIGDVLSVLRDADDEEPAVTTENLSDLTSKILHHFDSNMLLVILYIIPLCPHVDEPSSPRTHLHSWLVTWHNLFLSATQDSIRVAQSFTTPESSEAEEE